MLSAQDAVNLAIHNLEKLRIYSYFPSPFPFSFKERRADVVLYNAVDVNEGLYYDKDTRVVVDIDSMKRFTSPEFARKCFDMAGRLQSYDLTVKDQVLLKAVCFLCPGLYIFLLYVTLLYNISYDDSFIKIEYSIDYPHYFGMISSS